MIPNKGLDDPGRVEMNASPSFSFCIAPFSSLWTAITNYRKVCGLFKKSIWFACVLSSVLKHAEI